MQKKILLSFGLLFALMSHNSVSATVEEFNGYARGLAERWVILSNNDFRVLDSITRAELAKLAVNSDGHSPESCRGDAFNDVNFSLGDLCSYIEKSLSLGKISPKIQFFPAHNVSRGEAAKIFFQDKNVTPSTHKYSDEAEIDATFVDPIKKGIALGCISLLEKFRPNDPVSRGEAFKMASCIISNGKNVKSSESLVDVTKNYYGWGPVGSLSVNNVEKNSNNSTNNNNNNSGNNTNNNPTPPPLYDDNNPPQCVDNSQNGENTNNAGNIDYSIKISDNLKRALATGDASLTTKEEILEALGKIAKRRTHDANDLYKTVFELNDDFTENANSIKSMTWKFNGNSSSFHIRSKGGEFKPLFVSSARKYNIGIAGQVSDNARVLLLGKNPFASTEINDDTRRAIKNAFKWTMAENQNGQTCSLEEPENAEIVIANIPTRDGELGKTHAEVAKDFPNATINAVGACDGDKIESCINENTKLLVLSANGTCDNNINIHKNILQKAKNEGIGIVYITSHWWASTCTNETLGFYNIGFDGDSVYWNGGNLENQKPIITAPQESKLSEIIEKMENDTFDNSWIEACKNKGNGRGCTHEVFLNQYGNEVNNLRNVLRNLDSQNTKLFVDENPDTLRLMILLGDKYREEVEYTVNMEDAWAKWYKTYFANSTVYNNREFTTVEQNLGNFVTKKIGAIVSQDITLTAKTVNKEYAPGVYLWPGQKVTITRTDSSNANVSLFVNMLRDTTKIFNTNGYARPSFIKSPSFPIAPGQTLELSNPYGGPLYFSIPKVANDTEVTFHIEWAGTHPVITDPSNEEEVNKFIEDIKTTEADWVVVATEFLMIHSRLDHWNNGINNARYNGDMKAFFDDLWNYLIYNTYSIAGYNNGDKLIPTEKVQAYCDEFGIDCLAKKHQLPERIQHVVSDKYSACGDLCSGNPYDTTGPVGAVSWGDAHEIGHNLQHGLLKIYGNKSNENSNNVYPYAIYQKFNETAPARMEIRHLNRVKWTNIPQSFQWIKEWLAKDTPEAQKAYIKEAIWTMSQPGEDIYAKNSERYSFFVNLAHFMKYYNPDKVDTGWELFSMMNIMQREFSSNVGNATNWDDVKTKIGFDDYLKADADKVNGNEFMLVTSSKIIKKDMRPVFDMWGIDYSEKALAQVEAMNLTPADKFFFPMYNHPRYYQGETPILMTADAEYTYGIDYQP